MSFDLASRPIRLVLTVEFLLACALAGLSCSEVPGDGEDSGQDAIADAAEPKDASVDAQTDALVSRDATVPPDALQPWDSGPPIDAVAGSVIELPPSGLNITIGPWHHRQYVVYSEERSADEDVFLFDLQSRTELTVVAEVGKQSRSYIWEDTVMWSDQRWYVPIQNPQREIFQHDIQSGISEQITANGYFNSLSKFNSSHILYDTTDGVPPGSSGWNLLLMDRSNGTTVQLASYEDWWEGADMSETHISWVAHSPWESGSYKSVYLHDIAAGTTELLMGTVPGRQLQTSTWGDWVVWEDDRGGNWDIYAHQISTGQDLVLVDEPHDQIAAQVRDDLVVWMDYRWSGGGEEYTFLNDLVIYDLQSYQWRRVTGWTDYWGFGRAQGGWMLYRRHSGDPYKARLYAMNLLANLITDENGRVIPPP